MALIQNAYIGNKVVKTPYLGSNKLKSMYLGNAMIWGEVPDPNYTVKLTWNLHMNIASTGQDWLENGAVHDGAVELYPLAQMEPVRAFVYVKTNSGTIIKFKCNGYNTTAEATVNQATYNELNNQQFTIYAHVTLWNVATSVGNIYTIGCSNLAANWIQGYLRHNTNADKYSEISTFLGCDSQAFQMCQNNIYCNDGAEGSGVIEHSGQCSAGSITVANGTVLRLEMIAGFYDNHM